MYPFDFYLEASFDADKYQNFPKIDQKVDFWNIRLFCFMKIQVSGKPRSRQLEIHVSSLDIKKSSKNSSPFFRIENWKVPIFPVLRKLVWKIFTGFSHVTKISAPGYLFASQIKLFHWNILYGKFNCEPWSRAQRAVSEPRRHPERSFLLRSLTTFYAI